MVVAWLTGSGSLLVRRRAICDLIPKGVAVGMGLFKFAMTCNLERADGLGIFWEAVGHNTKELCSLLLRAWSNEIEVDWAGRTNLGRKDGFMPANHRHTTQSNKVCLNSNKIGIVQCGERANQAVLLEMPLVLPRSFLAPSVMSGIFMKRYSLNQPMLVLLKWSAIAMIVLRLSLDGFLGWTKLHEALLHSLPLQVKFAQIFSGMTFGKHRMGW